MPEALKHIRYNPKELSEFEGGRDHKGIGGMEVRRLGLSSRTSELASAGPGPSGNVPKAPHQTRHYGSRLVFVARLRHDKIAPARFFRPG